MSASEFEASAPSQPRGGFAAPLAYKSYRRIWIASVLSNFGLLIQGVGAAWAMTQLTESANLVALVQSAMMLPLMLLALPAGAIADMHDRRIVAIVALSLAFVSSAALAIVAYSGALTPRSLLGFCFLIGSAIALYGPSWQASVTEQVPDAVLPAAIALNTISYNIARSFGPALGGLIVVAAGSAATFVVNAAFYLPLIAVLLMWKRVVQPPRLPPEDLGRAVISGVRYILHTPPVRTVLLRTLLTGVIGGSAPALMPLIARDLLSGGAGMYGVLLGCFGIGAIAGAMLVERVRRDGNDERWVRHLTLVVGSGFIVVALSRFPALTGLALVVAGAAWMLIVALFNIGTQLSAPRWVAGRALAAFQAGIAGGIAIGSGLWGSVADAAGIAVALGASGAAMLAISGAGRWLPMPRLSGPNVAGVPLEDPDVRLGITGRSGPIVIEFEYDIDPAKARAFYILMQDVRKMRQRNGGYDWSISRDIGQPELWTERFHCPTWLDYLRQRSRGTQSDMELHRRAESFHRGEEPIAVRRKLERPVGSVRWRDDTPDRNGASAYPLGPPTGT